METTKQIQAWQIAKRWQEFDGEMRSALLRAILVVLFYAVQLFHYHHLADADRLFHRAVTFAATAWLMISLGIVIALRGEFMPLALKYVVTAIDLGIITILALLGSENKSLLGTIAIVVMLVVAAVILMFISCLNAISMHS